MEKEDSQNLLIKGIGASAGISIGNMYILDRFGPCVLKHVLKEDQVEGEIEKLNHAISVSKKQLIGIRNTEIKDIGTHYSYILNTHILMIEDSVLHENTENIIRDQKVNAEWALKLTLESILNKFNHIKDEYINERKKDIEQVVNLIIRNMIGDNKDSQFDLELPSIIVAHDLSASDTAQMKKEKVLGFATDIGGLTSHTGIIASALEIPAVVGLKNITEIARTGETIIVDGNDGIIILNPDQDTFEKYLKKQQQFKYYEKELLKTKNEEAVTLDGYSLSLMANIENPDELTVAARYGAKGVGLYRSEYLYMNRKKLPTEEDHFNVYKKIAIGTKPYCAHIRTLDTGGENIFSSTELDFSESNPVLGLRAIRFCLSRPEMFKVQLRGILRASHYGHLKIIYPMITGVEEIVEANKLLAIAKDELRNEGIPFDEKIEVGAMIETPSAALLVKYLAEEVDFFSIGTNDLIQYLLAIDRDNEKVAYLYHPFHPSVLWIIKKILEDAESAGVSVSVCGMMGGDPLNTIVLLGLGKIDFISMVPHSIPKVKKVIRKCSRKESIELNKKLFGLSNSKNIEELINKKFSEWSKD